MSCLRAPRVFFAVRTAFVLASRDGFRVVQFSVQENHVHLLVEADDPSSFTRGVLGLAIRIARAVNRALGRRGRVWGDRYHARPLTTPRAVCHALVYVLMNHRKHRRGAAALDPCSPVVPARMRLAATGWRRHGLIGFEERPRGSG